MGIEGTLRRARVARWGGLTDMERYRSLRVSLTASRHTRSRGAPGRGPQGPSPRSHLLRQVATAAARTAPRVRLVVTAGRPVLCWSRVLELRIQKIPGRFWMGGGFNLVGSPRYPVPGLHCSTRTARRRTSLRYGSLPSRFGGSVDLDLAAGGEWGGLC